MDSDHYHSQRIDRKAYVVMVLAKCHKIIEKEIGRTTYLCYNK